MASIYDSVTYTQVFGGQSSVKGRIAISAIAQRANILLTSVVLFLTLTACSQGRAQHSSQGPGPGDFLQVVYGLATSEVFNLEEIARKLKIKDYEVVQSRRGDKTIRNMKVKDYLLPAELDKFYAYEEVNEVSKESTVKFRLEIDMAQTKQCTKLSDFVTVFGTKYELAPVPIVVPKESKVTGGADAAKWNIATVAMSYQMHKTHRLKSPRFAYVAFNEEMCMNQMSIYTN